MSDDVALLLRRAGFGPTAEELTAARQSSYATALSTLVSPAGPDVGAMRAPIPRMRSDVVGDAQNRQITQLEQWWLDRVTVAQHQAVEKLLFFWHGHWATSVTKIRNAGLMLAQHRTLRQARDFVDMAHRMSVDPALADWLDSPANKKGAPNENLAREMCELFVLGIGHYTEKDVKEAARALTGFRVLLSEERLVLDRAEHDDGMKTILGTTGRFDVRQFMNLLLAQEAAPRFIATRLWYRYASPTQPIPEDLREQMAAEFPAPLAMLRVLLDSDAFQATRDSMPKPPIEWLVGAMRQLGLRPATMPKEIVTSLLDGLGNLGQRPFRPPSVGGWPAGTAWLTAAAAQVRLHLAGKLADVLEPGRLTPEETAYILGIEQWTDRTYALLKDAKNSRLLLILGLVSPEYLVT